MQLRCILLGVVAFCVITAFAVLRLLRSDAPVARLDIAPAALDLGEVWVTDSLHCSLPMSNTSEHEVVVTHLRASCKCTDIDPTSFTLRPGASQSLNLVFDLRQTSFPEQTLAEWPFSVVIGADVAIAGQRGVYQAWKVQATVKTPFHCSEPKLDFGQWHRSKTPPSLSVEFTPADGVSHNVATRCDSQLANSRVSCLENGRIRIQVSLVPDIHGGRHDFPLSIFGRTQTGVDVTFELPIVVTVLDEVAAYGSFAHLGLYSLGQRVTETVELVSRSGMSFDVVRIETCRQSVLVEEAPSDHVATKTFCVSEMAKDVGEQSLNVWFIVLPSATRKEIVVPVSFRFTVVDR